MLDHSKFAAFILSHGRPDKVKTLVDLQRRGYTGRWYIIIDNEDETGDEYRRVFGDEHVIEFDKAAVAETFDTADTQQDRRTIVYARNACFGIARDLGLDYFLELDDDYTNHKLRFYRDGRVRSTEITHTLDAVVEAMLTLLDDTGAASVAMCQGGDFPQERLGVGLLRKAMNTFFLRTDRPFRFVGRINEDVNTYVLEGGRGALFFTVLYLQMEQTPTQKTGGGMTEVYLDAGTYLKSFYTVMMAPSCTSITMMGKTDRRLHHRVQWDHAVPKILSESHRKPSLAP